MKILVTAGPTQEPINPVRFIGNRSSGKMGYAIAAAARERGHDVRLISGPVAIPAPEGMPVERVTTAEEMRRAVHANIGWCDALIMAAAVADWRPARASEAKLKKGAMPAALPLERTADILEQVAALKGPRIHIGFSAETGDVGNEALRKMKAKKLDLIVANDVSRPDSGFNVDTNKVTFFAADGTVEELPLLSKREVAKRIVAWLERPERAEMNSERLNQQIRFIREVDKLKQVYRQTLLMDGSRNENDAEHCWHVALAALLLAEHAGAPSMDLARVVNMLLVHDLVEIDAGDTYRYDDEANKTRPAREEKAAERIFGMLPPDQAGEMRRLWVEFEARATPEARFAAGLDRLQPLLHNYCTGGVAWRQHGVRASQVRERNRHIREGSEALWEFAQKLIDESVAKGYLAP